MDLIPRLNSFRAPLSALVVLLLLAAVLAAPVHAAALPAGFSETLIAGNLSNPTAFAFAPDGRIFVTLQGGVVRVIKNNALLDAPFVTVGTTSVGERGLLGIALHPSFPTTPYVYVYYTVPGDPPHNRLARFTASGDTTSGGEEILVEFENLAATNHNGGALHFGADNKLYVAVGENAVTANAQTLSNRLGKILRYNDDGTIPTDNPFYDGNGPNADAIWAFGLRNPFTFAFQPGTGRMFINDVGAGTWEEINDGIAGSNYGWNTCEGFCSPPRANFRDPLFAYPHSGGPFNGCAIVGGAFYNPTSHTFPADYAGNYFFADLCRGWIRRYNPASNTSAGFATGITTPVDLYVSNDGALYYLARGGGGSLMRVAYTGVTSNTATPTNTSTFTRTVTRTPTRVPATATRTPSTTPKPPTNVPPTATNTRRPTNAPTATPTVTATNTRRPTNAPTATPTATATNTRRPTRTPTATVTNTRRPTRLPTMTPTATATNTRRPPRTPAFTSTPSDGDWVWCAAENTRCAFTGTREVRFGSGNQYKRKTFTDGVMCNVKNFGDPNVGVAKHCDVH